MLSGALIAAMPSLPPWGRSSGSTAAADSPTEAMPPPRPVACCMVRARCHTTRTASASESTPAACSAAISPTLCPTTPSGAMPQ
jgi:hypothetical protein